MLGTFLNIDPRVFERLLNIKREYTNGLADVHVLGYCQGYIYRDSLGAKVFSDFQDEMLEHSKLNGKLRRWWRDIVGHEQRIVVAAVPKTHLIPVPTSESQLKSFGIRLLTVLFRHDLFPISASKNQFAVHVICCGRIEESVHASTF